MKTLTTFFDEKASGLMIVILFLSITIYSGFRKSQSTSVNPTVSSSVTYNQE